MTVNCTQCDCRTDSAVLVHDAGLLCPHCFDLLNPGEDGARVQAADVAAERSRELLAREHDAAEQRELEAFDRQLRDARMDEAYPDNHGNKD